MGRCDPGRQGTGTSGGGGSERTRTDYELGSGFWGSPVPERLRSAPFSVTSPKSSVAERGSGWAGVAPVEKKVEEPSLEFAWTGRRRLHPYF